MDLTKESKIQLEKKGIAETQLFAQLQNFEKGFSEVVLLRPATVGDGIIRFSQVEANAFAMLYNEKKGQYDIVKFIPASGAASRMFKDLYNFLDTEIESKEILSFFDNISLFAFYGDLKKLAQERHIHLDESLSLGEKKEVIRLLLTEEGMNYGKLPKALLKFHSYEGHKGVEILTPLEEHIIEGIYYAENQNEVKLHFTVSPEHIGAFKVLMDKKLGLYEQKNNVKISVQLSVQDQSTDQLVVDLNKKPLFTDKSEFLFNPGGHGALLNNLNRLKEDIVFIKNIDNVQKGKYSTVRNKKLLAGKLIGIQQDIKSILNHIERLDSMDSIYDFFQKSLHIKLSSILDAMSLKEQKKLIFEYLNRPIRVLGMVRNEGEPGGGPFWCEAEDSLASLQVVEKAQINISDKKQRTILEASTHFNPVDLVCYIKDYRGNKFDLFKFRDEKLGFISQKSKFGKEVLIQELPGLWNGAMGNWITVFVEVPLDTFTPVKTVLDLLRPAHQ